MTSFSLLRVVDYYSLCPPKVGITIILQVGEKGNEDLRFDSAFKNDSIETRGPSTKRSKEGCPASERGTHAGHDTVLSKPLLKHIEAVSKKFLGTKRQEGESRLNLSQKFGLSGIDARLLLFSTLLSGRDHPRPLMWKSSTLLFPKRNECRPWTLDFLLTHMKKTRGDMEDGRRKGSDIKDMRETFISFTTNTRPETDPSKSRNNHFINGLASHQPCSKSNLGRIHPYLVHPR